VSGNKSSSAVGSVERKSAVKSNTDGAPSAFSRTLTDLSADMYITRMKELKENLEEQASKLADRVCVKEFEKYRRMIREFLDELVSNGYTFMREDAFSAGGRHRFFATVKIVDEKLDELGKEVLKEQAEIIEIINKIDDIRGLLLDLMS
jgi:uncharacterized protein YaaR (DUF327 family)